MRVLVFGDSITQGYWDTDGGWVERLRRHYDELQVTDLAGRDEPSVFNLGISADNSGNVLGRMETETLARTRHHRPPIIIVQIGVNDSSTDSLSGDDTVSLPIEQYQQNLQGIIEKSQLIGSKLIFVGLSSCDQSMSDPVAWGDFHYTNAAIKAYENIMKMVAHAHDISFIPVFDAFKAEFEKGRQVFADGLHPSNEGHEVIYDIILPLLVPLLIN
jgi:lysophospholipase L1-like esterase